LKITTHLKQGDSVVSHLRKNTQAQMFATVYAERKHDYVLVEVPIPAGCTVDAPGPLGRSSWLYPNMEIHRDRVVFYVQALSEGISTFVVPIRPRFTGVFVLNLAQVSAMYFPSLNGNSGMGQVVIDE
jgi:uncharacterized protein YfaS (alpha-2-macroglobulin family)